MRRKLVIIIFMSLRVVLVLWRFSRIELMILSGSLILIRFFLLQLIVRCNFYISSLFFLDIISLSLIILTVIVSVVRWLAIIFFAKSKTLHSILIFSLSIFLVLSFCTKSPIYFYFWFEASLIPIFIIILGWGYQPERLFARKRIFLYTILGSLPLLILLVGLTRDWQSFSFYQIQLIYVNTNRISWEFFTTLIVLTSFLIKFPIYGVHLWLPKAHVEAPVRGSIILAGILLKLGGFGIFRLQRFIPSNAFISEVLFFFALFGGGLIRILCIVQTDVKVLIAYSSVSHMRIAIAGFLSQRKILCIGGLAIILSHGSSSAALFLGARTFYLRSFSRNLVLNKGILLWAPKLSILWALICVSNIAGPPSFNLFTELILFLGLLGTAVIRFLPLIVIGFFSAAYTLILYSSTQHRKIPHKMSFSIKINFMERLRLSLLIYLRFLVILRILPILNLI